MFFGLEWLLEDKIKTVEQILSEVEKVTTEEVIEVAKKIFKPQNYKLAVVGKEIDKQGLNKILQ